MKIIRLRNLLAAVFMLLFAASPALAVTLDYTEQSSSANLTLSGLSKTEDIYAVQIDMKLDGEYPKATFTANDRKAFATLNKSVSGGKTAITIYLVSPEQSLLDGSSISIGKLTATSKMSGVLPSTADIILLDDSLQPLASDGKQSVKLRKRTATGSSGSSGGSSSSGSSKKDDDDDDDRKDRDRNKAKVTPVKSGSDTDDKTTSGKAQFNDVKADEWYYKSVQYAVDNKLMNGVADGKFAPKTETSRAMIVTILYRIAGSPEVSGRNQFNDVVAGSWYADAVLWAEKNDIVSGYGNGKFAPSASITREQLATMLFRFAEYEGHDTDDRADISAYSDSAKVGSYAKEAMRWANSCGLINGMTLTEIGPKQKATRAQVAAILMRFCEDFQ